MSEPQSPESAGGGIPAWLPNAITMLRVVLIPATLWLLHSCAAHVNEGRPGESLRLWALAAFLGIGFSDLLDGYLARRFGLATQLGATLDAMADKLAQVSLLLFFALSGSPAFPSIPLWFVLLLFARDLFLSVGTLVVKKRKGEVEVKHELHGRLLSLLIFLLLLLLILDQAEALVTGIWSLLTLAILASTAKYVAAGWRQWEAR